MATRANVPDLAFAAFLVALGALAFALAGELSVGTAAAMGPGYVPRGLALIIMVYGLVLGVRAALAGRVAFPRDRVAAAVADFGVGRAVRGSAAACRPCADQPGGRDLRRAWPPTTCGCARTPCWRLALAIFAVLLFVTVLGLPIPVWPR